MRGELKRGGGHTCSWAALETTCLAKWTISSEKAPMVRLWGKEGESHLRARTDRRADQGIITVEGGAGARTGAGTNPSDWRRAGSGKVRHCRMNVRWKNVFRIYGLRQARTLYVQTVALVHIHRQVTNQRNSRDSLDCYVHVSSQRR